MNNLSNSIYCMFIDLISDPLFKYIIEDILPVLIAALLPIIIITKREKRINKDNYYDSIVVEAEELFKNYSTYTAGFILKCNAIIEKNILPDKRIKLSYADSEYLNVDYAQITITLMLFTNLYNRLDYEIPGHSSLPFLSDFIDEVYTTANNIKDLNMLLKNKHETVTLQQINELRPKLEAEYIDHLAQFLIQFSTKRKF